MTEKNKKIPMRMCIACREMKEKNTLLRVVRSPEGDIALDFSGKQNGRGAYLCDSEACVNKLKKGRLLNRVFSCEVPAEVYLAIEEAYFAKK